MLPHTEIIKIWADAAGKPAKFVECTFESFVELFGVFGEEFARQLKWGEVAGDWVTFPGAEGGERVSEKDLGIQEGEVVGLKGCLQALMKK